MFFLSKIIKDWKLNRRWKKEYGTDSPEWSKGDLSEIFKLPEDPDFVAWYNNLEPDKKIKFDKTMNGAFNLVNGYYDKLTEGIEKELIKRGNDIKPDTTRD